MSQRTRRLTSFFGGTLVAVSALSVGLLAPSASAAVAADRSPEACDTHVIPGVIPCDLGAVSGLLSGVANTAGTVLHRVNTDLDPFDGSN